MKVNRILNVIRQLIPILEYYRDQTVTEMLEDIYEKSCKTPPQTSSSSTGEPGVTLKRKSNPLKLSPEDAAASIRGMDEAERILFLASYTIEDMKKIADCLHLKYLSNIKRQPIIVLITYGQAHTVEQPLRPATGTKPIQEVSHIGDAVLRVPTMKQDEIINFLAAYNKSEILEIARRLNLRISSGYRKDNIILLIAKHFGYKDIDRQISPK
ncbi:MAG: hypothetical protein U9N81_14185 [Bacillota bacterium]|nr:hypothetical protein [Bacillota bacterium]